MCSIMARWKLAAVGTSMLLKHLTTEGGTRLLTTAVALALAQRRGTRHLLQLLRRFARRARGGRRNFFRARALLRAAARAAARHARRTPHAARRTPHDWPGRVQCHRVRSQALVHVGFTMWPAAAYCGTRSLPRPRRGPSISATPRSVRGARRCGTTFSTYVCFTWTDDAVAHTYCGCRRSAWSGVRMNFYYPRHSR